MNKKTKKEVLTKPQKMQNKLKRQNGLGSNYKPPRGFDYHRFTVGSIPIETLAKKLSHPKKVFLILHKGCFLRGVVDNDRKLLKLFSKKIGGLAVLVDYGVMPKNKFPKPLEEIYSVWQWLMQEHKPQDVTLIGEGVGASLAISLCLKLQTEDQTPRSIVCFNPFLDMSIRGDSYYDHFYLDKSYTSYKISHSDLREEILSQELFEYGGNVAQNDPLYSPVYAEYRDFPPVYIAYGGDSVLSSDAETLIEKLTNSGSLVEVQCAEGRYGDYFFDKPTRDGKKQIKLAIGFIKRAYNLRKVAEE